MLCGDSKPRDAHFDPEGIVDALLNKLRDFCEFPENSLKRCNLERAPCATKWLGGGRHDGARANREASLIERKAGWTKP